MSFYCNEDFKRNRESCKIYPTVLSAINIFLNISRRFPTMSGIFQLNLQEDFLKPLLAYVFDDTLNISNLPKKSGDLRRIPRMLGRCIERIPLLFRCQYFSITLRVYRLRPLPWQRSDSKNSDWVFSMLPYRPVL